MEQRKFGDAGATIVIEEFLRGEEVSVHAITDGDTLLLLPTAQDHKRARATATPAPTPAAWGRTAPRRCVTDRTPRRRRPHDPRPDAPRAEARGHRLPRRPLRGPHADAQRPEGPRVERALRRPRDAGASSRASGATSPTIFLAAAQGRLDEVEGIDVDPRPVVGVVMASGGYPEAYKTGKPISGLEDAGRCPTSSVFHAGTRRKDGALLTAGGRVLTVDRTRRRLRATRATAPTRASRRSRSRASTTARTSAEAGARADGPRERMGPRGRGERGRRAFAPRRTAPLRRSSRDPRAPSSRLDASEPLHAPTLVVAARPRAPPRRARRPGVGGERRRARPRRGAEDAARSRTSSSTRRSSRTSSTWLRVATGWNFVVKRDADREGRHRPRRR